MSSATGRSTPSSPPRAVERAGHARHRVDEGHVEVEGDDEGHGPIVGTARPGTPNRCRGGARLRHWTLDLDAATSPGARQHPAGVRPDGDADGALARPRPASRRRRAGRRATGDTGAAELFLVTLDGAGLERRPRRRDGQGVPRVRAGRAGRHPRDRRCRRPGLPLDDRAQRVRRPAHRRPGPGPGRRPRGGHGRAGLRTSAGRRPHPVAPRPRPTTRVSAGPASWSGSSTPASGPTARCSPTSAASAGRPATSGAAARPARAGPTTCATARSWARSWFVDGFGADRVRSGARALPARRRRPRHPDGLDRRRQRRRQRAGAGPARGPVRRRRAPGPARRLQGVLDRPRPARRRLLHRRPGHGHRPRRRRPRRRAEPLRRRRRRRQAASTPSSAPCSAPRRPTSSWSPRPATAAPARTPPTPRPGSPPSAAPPAPPGAAPWSRPGSGWPARWPPGPRVRPARLVLGARVASAGATASAVALLPARQPRRRARRRTHRRVRARPHRTRRQVRGRRAGRRRGHGAGQHQPRPGHRRLPQRADRPPDQGRRPPPGPVDARPPRPPGPAAARRRAAHPRTARRLDQLGRPDGLRS